MLQGTGHLCTHENTATGGRHLYHSARMCTIYTRVAILLGQGNRSPCAYGGRVSSSTYAHAYTHRTITWLQGTGNLRTHGGTARGGCHLAWPGGGGGGGFIAVHTQADSVTAATMSAFGGDSGCVCVCMYVCIMHTCTFVCMHAFVWNECKDACVREHGECLYVYVSCMHACL